MNVADSTALFCITDGICLDWGKIICTVIGIIIGGIFNHFLELWRQDRKMKIEDENKKKWLKNDFFEKARQYFAGYANNMINASIIANTPNQNQDIESTLSDFASFRGLVSPCPFYVNDAERQELFKCVDLMDAYMYNLKCVNYYKGELDKFQQWENASQGTVPVNSPQYQHASYVNQLNIDKFDESSRNAENVRQIILSILSDQNSVINKKFIKARFLNDIFLRFFQSLRQ